MAKTELGTLESASPRQQRKALKLHMLTQLADSQDRVFRAVRARHVAEQDQDRLFDAVSAMENARLPQHLICEATNYLNASSEVRRELAVQVHAAHNAHDELQRLYDEQFPPWYVRLGRWLKNQFGKPPSRGTTEY